MSAFWLTPAAPGTIAPGYLDKVREFHGVVRRWIEGCARARNDDRLLANIPYVDLMFAFGFATLGDHGTANQLIEEAPQWKFRSPRRMVWRTGKRWRVDLSRTICFAHFAIVCRKLSQAIRSKDRFLQKSWQNWMRLR